MSIHICVDRVTLIKMGAFDLGIGFRPFKPLALSLGSCLFGARHASSSKQAHAQRKARQQRQQKRPQQQASSGTGTAAAARAAVRAHGACMLCF